MFFGSTVQSAKNPNLLKATVSKEPPIERSGTAMMALVSPWLISLSSAINMSARDLPEAGGAFNKRYWEFLASKARSCISRMPNWLVLVLFPVWA
ncbi:hypothetical protein D3C87_1798430 [compost metagenome]